jgi:hypothetical protein
VIGRCCMCKRNEESCDVASAIWSALFSRFWMSWIMPRHVVDLFACWCSSGKPKSVEVCEMVPTCLF